MSQFTPRWAELPDLVIDHIYMSLGHFDRLNASQTCSHWRSVVFQKKYFKDLKFRLDIDDDHQLEFYRDTLCYMTRELTIKFDFLNIYHIEKIRSLLCKIQQCENLIGLRFETNTVGLTAIGDTREHPLINIKKDFVRPLKMFLASKHTTFKVLDFGCIEAYTYYAVDLIESLGRTANLETLTLASIKYDTSNYPIVSIDPKMLMSCTSLQVLSLDYDSLNEEVLRALDHLPLRKLLICIHGLDREHPGISENAWAAFAECHPNVDLILSLVYAYEAVEVLQVRILRRMMPITHLRVLFCDFMNVEALEWMSQNNNKTLKSIKWIDSAFKSSNKNVMDLFLRSGQDPFVMMSWRCKSLEEIMIHGYVLDPHNVVGMSRLRGRSLKRLEISMLDTMPNETKLEAFNNEINMLLGQTWAPRKMSELHPSLGYLPVSDDCRDELVYEMIRQDINS